MTVGSISFDNFVQVDDVPSDTHGWRGAKGARSWSGDDRVKTVYPKQPVLEVFRDGKILRFPRLNRNTSRPPKRARDVEHAYSMSHLLQEQDLVTYTSSGITRTRGRVVTFGVTDWGAATLLTANDQLKLLGKLRDKMQGSDFNMSVFLGEGHQALELIAGSAVKIAKSLFHLRKGDVAGATRSLLEGTSRAPLNPYKNGGRYLQKWIKPTAKNLSGHWLELQYGWLPLLDDAKSGAEFLAHKLSVPAQQSYRMSVRREEDQSRFTVLDNVGGVLKGVHSSASRYHQRFLKVVVTEHPSMLAQLGLLDPQLVAWELVPFSFVADWFIPIGSYLEARAISSAVVGKYVTTDKKHGRTHPIDGEGYFPSANYTFKQTTMTRVISAAPKIPLPEFKSLDKVASWQHCANAIALLIGGFAGRGSKGY